MRQAPDIHVKAPLIHASVRGEPQAPKIPMELDFRFHGDDLSGMMKTPVEGKPATLEFRVVQGRAYARIHLAPSKDKSSAKPPPWVLSTLDDLRRIDIPTTRSELTTRLANHAQEFSLGPDATVDGKRCHALKSKQEHALVSAEGPPLLIRRSQTSGANLTYYTYETGPAIKAPAHARPAPPSTSETPEPSAEDHTTVSYPS
jgi:hypothetical protein